MKRHAKQIVLWAAFLLLPMSVDAQITDYTGSLGATEYLNFMVRGRASSFLIGVGVYVGPYTGPSTRMSRLREFSLICVDFDNSPATRWVNVTGRDLGRPDVRLVWARRTGAFQVSPGGLPWVTFRRRVWRTSGQSAWSAIHAAIWTIMSDGARSEAMITRVATTDPRSAAPNATVHADGWYVLSAADGYNGQEMLIRTPASTVPEPSTYLLMATGLLFLVFFGRKRMGELDEG
jgi:hypothetical protein